MVDATNGPPALIVAHDPDAALHIRSATSKRLVGPPGTRSGPRGRSLFSAPTRPIAAAEVHAFTAVLRSPRQQPGRGVVERPRSTSCHNAQHGLKFFGVYAVRLHDSDDETVRQHFPQRGLATPPVHAISVCFSSVRLTGFLAGRCFPAMSRVFCCMSNRRGSRHGKVAKRYGHHIGAGVGSSGAQTRIGAELFSR
jgi:hypothetical protein